MSPEEKRELDEWVEKEYPKSMSRLNSSDPYHRLGKRIIVAGIFSYVLFVVLKVDFFEPLAMILLGLGMVVEVLALLAYFRSLSNENKFKCLFPDLSLCSDNAAMIALVGLEKFKKKLFNELNFKVNPRWQLDDKAKFLKGAGVKI